jgi:HlyD family secretion protein
LKWDFSEPVKSPISGIVSKVFRESSGPIARGEPIVEMIDPESLRVEAEALTTEAVKIPAAAPVAILGWGKEKPLQGRVSKVSRAGFLKLSALGIEEEKTLVYVEILDPPVNQLGDTFHVELEIRLSEQENVLTVPLGALFKNNEQWALYTVENKKARLKSVKIGKRNASEAVITEGLQEGDEVILFPGDRIKDQIRVRAR